MIVPLIPPEGLAVLNPKLFYVIYKMGKYISMGCIALCVIIKLNRHSLRISFTYLLLASLVLCDVFITFAKDGDIKRCISAFLPALLLCLIAEVYTEHLHILIDCLFFYLLLLVLINGICMILYPDGMYLSLGVENYSANWFLGYKSSFQYYFLPLLCCALIRIRNKRHFFFSIVTLVIIHVETICSQNKMLLVGLLLIDIFLCFYLIKRDTVFNAYILALVAGITHFLFICVPISNLKILSFIINELLHKNIIKGRAYIWNITIKWIKKAPIIGYGWIDSNIRYGMYGRVSHAHNQFLEFLFQGGIVLFIIYILLIGFVSYKLHATKELYSSYVFMIILFGLYIMTIVEIFSRFIGAGIWLLFLLATKTEYIEKRANKYVS